jgi:pimeloyl-ACP methyl ester carboxylesterase
MAWRIWVVLALLALIGLSACEPKTDGVVDKKVRIGTYSLHIRCMGKGGRTVVIDTGVGGTSERWRDFQSKVAQVARVCTYDRAGYGSSEPGPLPRTS